MDAAVNHKTVLPDGIATMPWPEYESHKVVRAARIVRIHEPDGHNTTRLFEVQPEPDDLTWEVFLPSVPAMGERAAVGDFAVLYPDGFRSISPAKAFEEGYTRKA
jgi:hypothetical protein